MSAKDLTGQRFNMLTVIERVPDPYYKQVCWLCRCDCGNTCVRTSYTLTHEISYSCGCVRRRKAVHVKAKNKQGIKCPRKRYDGKTYGHLTGVQSGNNGEWLWRCSCGGLIYAHAQDVISGRISNCGCMHGEQDRRITAPPPMPSVPVPDRKDKRFEPRDTTGSKIARLRVERGLTQAQLAQMIGMSHSVASWWESGKVKPSKQSLYKLAAALQCDFNELIDTPAPRCRICGRELSPPRRVYCSAECRREADKLAHRVEHPSKHPDGTVIRTLICQDCGVQFTGHIKSKRCPRCQKEAGRLTQAKSNHRQATGEARHIGSLDYCERCGNPYIVNGSMQRYCKDCAEQAVRDNTRAHVRQMYKERYSDAAHREQKNNARRKDWQRERACAICGKTFTAKTPCEKFCSDECRAINTRNHQRRAEARRKGKRKRTKS